MYVLMPNLQLVTLKGQSTGCCKAAPWFCLHFRTGAGTWNGLAEGTRQPPPPLLLMKTGAKKISIYGIMKPSGEEKPG